MTNTISLEFDGYWRDAAKDGIPSQSGIYVVYDGVRNTSNNTVRLRQIIYIGESVNVHNRIAGHEKRQEWRRHLGEGGQIYFSFAPVKSSGRERGEAAMIYQHKPPVNTEYKHDFPFPTTTMNLSGCTRLLKTSFTVYQTGLSQSAW